MCSNFSALFYANCDVPKAKMGPFRPRQHRMNLQGVIPDAFIGGIIMPVANPRKTVDVSSIPCGGTATVTLGFQSAASLALKPADIVLIMDRSSSMTRERMTFAKAAAKQLIDMVDGARDGATRMGIVSFGTDATEDVALTGDFTALKPAIDALVRGGYTNHKAAFEAAGNLLSIPSAVRQVVIMFTDGETTNSPDADPAAQALKDKGVEIFCIGLATDPAPLKRWASDPDSTHVAYTDDAAQLERVFREIGAEVILAGAMDVVIQEQLTPDFKIVKIHTPDVGTATITGPQTLTWSIDATGIWEQPDFTNLSFDVMHIGNTGGVLPVNQSVLYTDREGNTLEFPSPTVEVDCSKADIYPEPCPGPTEFTVEGCQDAAHVVLGDAALQGLGRIVQVDVTLKAVCPSKRVAASIILMEVAPDGAELPRGVKHMLVPAQAGDTCKDITLKCVQFSLPEALDATGTEDSICNPRQFTAQVIANYVDTDFACCEAQSQMI